MKMRFDFPDAPAAQTPPTRGAAPVGVLDELPALELAAIVYLRAWCADEEQRAQIAGDFRLVLGADRGALAYADFDALMRTVLAHTRRPLMRHALGCRCFGGDESAFAGMIAAGAAQDRETAMLFATVLVDGPAVWDTMALAGALGQAFLHLARGSGQGPRPTHPAGRTEFKH